jgi:hypothetical protein
MEKEKSEWGARGWDPGVRLGERRASLGVSSSSGRLRDRRADSKWCDELGCGE